MKCAEDWLVEVHDFDIDVGEVIWMRDANLAIRIRELVWLDCKVIVENLAWSDMSGSKAARDYLFRVSTVIDDLHNHSAVVQDSFPREFS
jgi:hypothetical protein